jgi:hypothetical protein
MNKKIIGLAILFLFFVIIYFKLISNSSKENNTRINNYLEKLNLEFTGIVTDKKDLEHNVYRIFLDIRKSNVESYYPKDTLNYYLCIIRGAKGELVVSNPNDFLEGDSVIVSSKKDSCFIFRNDKLENKWKLYVVDYHTNGY